VNNNISSRCFSVNRSFNEATPITAEKVATPIAAEQPRGRLLFITLTRSPFHQTKRIQTIVRQMGFHRMHQTQVLQDTPANRGLVYMVRHLVQLKGLSTAELFPQGTSHLDIGPRLPVKQKSQLYFSRNRRALKEKQLAEAEEYLEKYAHFKQQ
jgi:ribosomal protein L30/L7E